MIPARILKNLPTPFSVTYEYNGANELMREANGLAQKTVQPRIGSKKSERIENAKSFFKKSRTS